MALLLFEVAGRARKLGLEGGPQRRERRLDP
jgi:hypothetical protein